MTNSAGSLVAATLESVGYEYQSIILDRLTDPLTNEIGGLVYLFGIALAVLMTATQGRYKMGAWLLIGPPLFFATIMPRTAIDNASWRFGRQDRNNELVEREKNEILDNVEREEGDNPRVSRLFSVFINLVSATQQEMVNIISRTREDADLALVARAELFSQLHADNFREPGLVTLFHRAMLNDCGNALDYARAANDPLFRPRQFHNYSAGRISQTEQAQEAQSLLESRNGDFRTLYTQFATIRDKNLGHEEAKLIASSEVSGGGQEYSARVANLMQGAYTCEDLWRFVLRYINIQSEQTLQRVLSRGAYAGISQENMVKLVKQAMVGEDDDASISAKSRANNDFTLDQNDLESIRNVMAKFLLRNEITRDSTAARMSYWVSGIETQDVQMRFAGEESLTERARTSVQEWHEKSRFINAAAGIPYVQGILLYILSTVFPFFSLLLLIPGKHGGFILWFMLWIWVKSWDVMMAMVTILSDVIFSILSVQKQRITEGTVDAGAELENMELALISLNELDPTFQLSSYYTIIATAMLAIPSVTSYIILGGMKGGAGIISKGISRNSAQASGHFLGYAQQKIVSQLGIDHAAAKTKQMEAYQQNQSQDRNARDGVKNGLGNRINTDSAVKGIENLAMSPKPIGNGKSKTARAQAFSKPSSSTSSGRRAAKQRIFVDAKRGGTGQGATLSGGRQAGAIKNPVGVNALLNAQYAGDISYGKLHKSDAAALQEQTTATSIQAVWDSLTDPIQVRRVKVRSVLGALTLPEPGFQSNYGGAEEQKKFILKSFDQEQSRKIADWEFKRRVSSSATEVMMKSLNSVYETGLLNKEYGNRLNDKTKKEVVSAIRGDVAKISGVLSATNLRSLSPQTTEYLKSQLAVKHYMPDFIKNDLKQQKSSKQGTEYYQRVYQEILGSAYGDSSKANQYHGNEQAAREEESSIAAGNIAGVKH